MTEVSRNAPCPCGSGKKHKKCCLKPSEAQTVAAETQHGAVALVRFRDADRTGALEKLMTFAERSEFRDDLQAAQQEFAGDDMEAVFDDPIGQIGFVTWSIYDYPVRGHTLCDRFLQARGVQLTPPERRYLQSMSGTRMGLYIVGDVKMHEGFTLADLAGDERYEIHEEKATEQLSENDIIAARVAPGASGGFEIDGAIYTFGLGAVGALVLDLRAAGERGRLKEEAAVIINQHYKNSTFEAELPEILTTPEGDEIAPSRVFFSVRGDVRAKLAGDRRFEDAGDGEFVWMNSSQIAGSVTLEDDRLVVETMSRERAEKARKVIAKLLGADATFELIETESLAEMMSGDTDSDDEPNTLRDSFAALELSRDELDALGDFLERDDAPEDRLPLVACEGFFAALHCGPEPISAAEWFPIVIGDRSVGFRSESEGEMLVPLFLRFYNEIGTKLADPDLDFEPAIADERGKLSVEAAVLWASGFVQGLNLRHAAWQPLVDNDAGAALVPILELAACMTVKSRRKLDSKANRQYAELLADCVLDVYDFWHGFLE